MQHVQQHHAARKSQSSDYADWLAAVLARAGQQGTPPETHDGRVLARVARAVGGHRQHPDVRRRVRAATRAQRSGIDAFARLGARQLIAVRQPRWSVQDPTITAAPSIATQWSLTASLLSTTDIPTPQIWAHRRYSVEFDGGRVIDADDLFDMDEVRFAVTAAYLPADSADKITDGTLAWSDFVVEVGVHEAAPDPTGRFVLELPVLDDVATIHGLACWSMSIVVVDRDQGDLAATLEALESASAVATAVADGSGAAAPFLAGYPPLAAIAQGVSMVAELVAMVTEAFGGLLELFGNPDDVLGVAGLTAKDVYAYKDQPPAMVTRRETVPVHAIGAHYRLDFTIRASDPGKIDDVGSVSLLPEGSVTVPLAWGGGPGGIGPDLLDGSGTVTFFHFFAEEHTTAAASAVATKGSIVVQKPVLHVPVGSGQVVTINAMAGGPGSLPVAFTAPAPGSLVIADVTYSYVGALGVGPGMAVGSLTLEVG